MEKSDLVMSILLQLGLIFVLFAFPTFHHEFINNLTFAFDGVNAVIAYELIYLKKGNENDRSRKSGKSSK